MITYSQLGQNGRLGNQLFQYATARSLSLRKKAPLLLDCTWYQQTYDDVTPRELLIKELKTTGAIICGDDYELYPNPDNLNELYAQKDDDQALHHPGVSLAIYEEFGARVNVINGFWWVFTHNGEYSREFDKIDTDPNPSVF